MLLENLSRLCERSDKYRIKFGPFLKSRELSRKERDRILEFLCEFLMVPECTRDIAECFPRLVLVLLSLAIGEEFIELAGYPDANDVHRLNCVVLGILVGVNPDVVGFVLRYFELNPAPFESLNLDTDVPSKRQRISKVWYPVSKVSDHDIVVACYNILKASINHFKHNWNWSKFYVYLTNNDDSVKWVALKCVAIILDMSEFVRLHSAKSLLKNFDEFLVEHENRRGNVTLSASENSTEEVDNVVKDLSSVVSVAGVLLPVLKTHRKLEHHDLVPVPSMRENLQSLALAIASRKCVCLQGPVGCGKTALVEYLARVTGHDSSDFTKVQLGDQTDSKMLLGTYRCTDIPGEFVWQPGVLTQAITAGKWLLLEDIDSAALDVASVISNLIETGTLSVPGYRDTIYVKSGFQLFLTQRLIVSSSGAHRQSSGASSLLEKNWLCINIEPLSRDELITIVRTLFPPLNTVATRMVDVFLLFSMGSHDTEGGANESLSLKTGRLTSTRDLIKWCTRAVTDFVVSSPDSALKIFQDAIDIFCCSVPNQEHRLSLATAVGYTLGIVKIKAEYFCNTHKPTIKLTPEFFVAGRGCVPRQKATVAQFTQEKQNFSFTRPSACLLERIASCVAQQEPVLLVGETGTGKTSSVQYLARCTGHKLIVINMNQQSESADLLGGYKPVDIKFLIMPIREEFEVLFRSYFAIEPNKKFLEHVALSYKQGKWKTLVTLMNHSTLAAVRRLKSNTEGRTNGKSNTESQREHSKDMLDILSRWERLALKLDKLILQVKTQFSLAFAFVEGSLIKALQEGYWVLLDEINLANAETLECLSGLLEGSSGSLSLLERGDKEAIKRHSQFTIFACMNPATDVGKKELPVGLRNRFTEFYVDELTERSDLQLLVNSYLEQLNLPLAKQEAIVRFYLHVRKEALNSLYDGTAHKPHYSLRTLCRALSVAASNPCGVILRSLYEAFCLSFLTQLDHNSYPVVQRMICQAILNDKTAKAVLGAPIPKPRCGSNEEYINFEGYWVVKGSMDTEKPKNYILTESVRRNLKDLVRVVSIGKMPVLLQGDTSVGKTSLITYLAKASGHVCVRINNHEHTDLQEYVGSYVADETGKLVFREGVLVEAMRKGHWIILDELNLAPSDVLEALNRVLDDNRELFIPETQQTVKAHTNFMLFATQNPPGVYGGRKVLSRAFRNRFVELHFDEIPANELQMILHERCSMPDSYCKQVINVMTDLQIRRKTTAAFAGKQGFITLRDLFRWGERYRLAPDVGDKLYDWSQHMADEGYLVLAAKVRRLEEANEIREVIRKHLKRDVDPETLFTLSDKTSPVTRFILEKILNKGVQAFKHVVWTYHMRRMAVLVGKSCQFKEPVLLVGETGGGKTTICQVIAEMNDQKLYAVNCHMHTESSDFLGNLRPVREHSVTETQKLFEWVDGPLIKAMQNGDLFLADEISLADDSVLERLNSLLEPERSLLLAEKGVDNSINENESDSVIVAHRDFVFIGTMNPGGDYGKKELSPALRNRFTEIWCEGCTQKSDLQAIIEHNLDVNLQAHGKAISTAMLDFQEWLAANEIGKRFTVSIRDILTWVNFMNSCNSERLDVGNAYSHGAYLTYIDSLGSGLTSMESFEKLKEFRKGSLAFLSSQVERAFGKSLFIENSMENDAIVAESIEGFFGIPPFFIPKGSGAIAGDETFTFTAPTTGSNTLKLLRGLQLNKPLLLEGSPGVGKTSLVSALAKASGNKLLRINLSDQTDISDLFGADLPIEGGKGGEFAWKDGPFLRALRVGHWILLDELNLASQSVLEGLNACLDHRGEIYVPELGRTFSVEPGTKLFACQNPLKQGGARRGLPKSFLNRFTQVFIDALTDNDLEFIAKSQFQELSIHLISTMIKFNGRLSLEAGTFWGYHGSPWEMNLRDITRWCEVTVKTARQSSEGSVISYNPGNSIELIYVDRMRTVEDKEAVRRIYREMFSTDEYPLPPSQPIVHITESNLYLGDIKLTRSTVSNYSDTNLLLIRDQMPTLRSLARCIEMNWMSVIVGGSGCGKSSVVRTLAQLMGRKLRSIVVNSAMDTTEILGGFEQTDYNRHLEQILELVENLLYDSLKMKINDESLEQVAEYHGLLEKVQNLSHDNDITTTMSVETELFLRKMQELSKLVRAMKTLNSSFSLELKQIENKLEQLKDFVEQDKCLNAGGKFEWVDSVLVKCLREGSWLLVDQVNLCSPAVLDRLNGLLEPGGVLSIGERGVDSNGNVVTVAPHDNFRLFLTMDPRYGELSRAMRNRGVEIYMLGHGEKNSESNQLDQKAMLFDCGLTKSNHQEALLEIHQKISKDNTVERIGVIQLLNSAFLITQQISRGFSTKQAFHTACVDVYLKAQSINNLQVKERLISTIDEAINRFNVAVGVESAFDLDAATLSMHNLQDNSKLTIVRQQGLLLTASVNAYQVALNNIEKKNTTSFLNEFLKLSNDNEKVLDVDIAEILPHMLLNFYEQSSLNDIKIRNRWLDKILANIGLNGLRYKNDSLAKEIVSFNFSTTMDGLPWDVTQLSDMIVNIPREKAINDANRLALRLCLRVTRSADGTLLDDLVIDKNKQIISIMEYSNAVHHGKLTSHLKNQPLITNFVMFVTQLDNCIDLILKDRSMIVGTKDYVNFRKNLKWRDRFYNLGKLTLINKAEKSKDAHVGLEEVILMLRVHYKWVVKFIQDLLKTCKDFALEEKCKVEIRILTEMITDINSGLSSVHDPFRKIAKKVKKFLNHPLPYSSETIMRMHARLKKVSNSLSLWNDRYTGSKLKLELKIVNLSAENTLEVRSKIISLWHDIYLCKSFDEATLEILSEAERFCSDNHLDLQVPVEISEVKDKAREISEKKMIMRSAEVQLWPFYEYMFLLFAHELQSKICRKLIITPINITISTCLFPKFAEIPGIPTNLMAVLNAILIRIENLDEPKRLLPELFVRLAQFGQYSCAVKSPERILHWSGLTEDDMEEIADIEEKKQMNYSIYGPMLVNLVSELILGRVNRNNESSPLATATLGTYKARINQLKALNDTLWMNSIALVAKRYNCASNDLDTLKSHVQFYLIATEQMETESNVNELVMAKMENHIGIQRSDLEEQYRNDYVQPLAELREVAVTLNNMEGAESNSLERGKAWILLGYLQVFLFGNLGYIDPVHKVGLRLGYIEEDIVDFKNANYVAMLQTQILGCDINHVDTYPKISEINRCLKSLFEERNSLKSCNAIRPSPMEFVALAKEAVHFRRTLASYSSVRKHLDQLTDVTIKMSKSRSSANIRIAGDVIREAETWLESVRRFSEQIENKFLPGYPDIVLPLLEAAIQMQHGVRIIMDDLKRLISSATTSFGSITVEHLMHNLIRFPTLSSTQKSLLDLVDLCVSQNTRELINMNIKPDTTFMSIQEQFRMIKSGLDELYNYIALNRELSKSLWMQLNRLLQQILLIWRQQQKEEKDREAAKTNMYKNKVQTKENLTEDEELAAELRNLFPSHRETDFADIEEAQQHSLEQREVHTKKEESYGGLITEEDIWEVHELYSNIVKSFTSSEWLMRHLTTATPNYIKPLIQRYQTFGVLLKNVSTGLNVDFTRKLYTSLNFLTTLTMAANEGKNPNSSEDIAGFTRKSNKAYDFYKDDNVEEVKQCLTLLERIVERIDELLLEWPDHPSLRSIKNIVQRIYSFSVTSSVSRFLTGLELLLVKIQEWEENAHSGVSLSDYSAALTQQIISWRKLELACWKDCLSVAFDRLKSKASKWFFLLYALIECYVTKTLRTSTDTEMDGNINFEDDEEPITPKKLLESLDLFMTGSSLVEFGARLDLLLTFHCHVYYLDPCNERDELLAILWNVYNYYNQFSSNVNAKIAALKAPIEKKLKDFVKIARWNDISYWAIKEAVHKTHTTLHKFIKEYETGLKESVATCLIIKPSSYNTEANKGVWDQQREKYAAINPIDFLVPKVSEAGFNDEILARSNLITRVGGLLTKAKRLCKEAIVMSSYPVLRVSLEQFLEEVIDRSSRLKDQEIDKSLPKSKQKAQAKSILQQKKMALTNYFKTLTRIGVSYRIGVLSWNNRREEIMDLTTPPLNLSAVVPSAKMKRADQQMLVQWESCDRYYYQCLVKLNALNDSLASNRTDLGLQNMERCKGYSTHIMLMANRQKKVLTESFNFYVSLRLQLSTLSKQGAPNANLPNQRDLLRNAENLKELLIVTEASLEQLKLYLQACPNCPDFSNTDDIFSLETCDIPMINAKKGDPVWERASSLLRESLSSLQTVMQQYNAVFSNKDVTLKLNGEYCKRALVITPAHFKVLTESYETLEKVRLKICDFAILFGAKDDSVHPIVDSICYIDAQIKNGIDEFKKLQVLYPDKAEGKAEKESSTLEKYETDLEHLITSVLLKIQKKYKNNLELDDEVPEVKESENEKDGNEDEGDELEENILKEKLIESLNKDVEELQIDEIFERFNNLLRNIQEMDSQTASHCNRLLIKCMPLLKQYLLFAQFYLNEQVASFRVTCKLLYLQLNVFLDLATNGFCVPKDLDLEEGEADGSQEGVEKGGMGLGDGEGQRDVSDRIENEDQLDDARPADREKDNSEDKDCKEEDKGIDMSEDFDSKLQDVEKKDNDEEEQNDDDEKDDLDKQMGDTEKGADQLDEQIWGDDEEEPEDEDNEEEEGHEEERGKGEQIGDKEMGAKDDGNKEDTPEEKDQEQGKQEEKKKEINDMDESETNDDQIDPYHGKHNPEPEPEPFDLPEDMNLDDDNANENNPADEENPFDIDALKESKPPPEPENEDVNTEEEKKEDANAEDSSDDEDGTSKDPNVNDIDEEKGKEEDAPDPEKQNDNQIPQASDDKTEEEKEKEDENETQEEKAEPSMGDSSKQMDAAEQIDVNKDGSRDKVANQQESKDQQENGCEENNQDVDNDKGTGQAQSEQQNEGHSGSSMQKSVPMTNQPSQPKQMEKRKNPGKSDESHSLVDEVEPDKKKLKTIHSEDKQLQDSEEEGPQRADDTEAEMCQHVKNSEKFDDYTVDAATEEQVKQQASNVEEEKDLQQDEAMDVEMHQDEEVEKEIEDSVKQNAEKVSRETKEKDKTDLTQKRSEAESGQMEATVDVEGEAAETVRVARGDSSTFHTNLSNLEETSLTTKQIERKRLEVETMLGRWTHTPPTEEAVAAWNCLSAVTDVPARDLSEKLRLVLEPTQASRLKGDYRTGRRINMRKIIPYIASQFRKDKIWLRRTKPSKRDYQIVLALDDSSSMVDNHSKELAFESLSLISRAMTYLEVGQLCVISFGEETKVLHPLSEPFTEQSGSRLIQEMRFDQKKTMVGQLVDFTVDMFDCQSHSSDNAKLLVVLSDGRGVFSEGTELVNRAVRRARLADIFLVFIIVDNPVNKDSILDIRMPVFQGGKLLGIRSYMDSFPFPFYMILRDINTLPSVLSDALRQWFEVVGKIDV